MWHLVASTKFDSLAACPAHAEPPAGLPSADTVGNGTRESSLLTADFIDEEVSSARSSAGSSARSSARSSASASASVSDDPVRRDRGQGARF